MSTLLDQPVSIVRTLVTTPEQARAVEDPARAKIVEILYHRDMTVDQITEELRKTGFDKAITTVRHHIRILKNAELIQVTRIDEIRGTVSKRYSTQIRLLNYDAPEDFENRYAKIIGATTVKMDRILRGIKTTLSASDDEKMPESYCHYLALEILNRAATSSLEPRKN